MDDLLFTYYDQVNDTVSPVSNIAGIWFISGVTRTYTAAVQ
jgi:hypothetical protein